MLCVASLDPSATGKKCSVSRKTDQLRPSRGEFKCHLSWAERLNHPAQAGASVHAHTHTQTKEAQSHRKTAPKGDLLVNVSIPKFPARISLVLFYPTSRGA